MSGSHVVAPSVTETAFNCPHCRALTTQSWYRLYGDMIDGTPTITAGHEIDESKLSEAEPDEEKRGEFRTWLQKIASGAPFLDRRENSAYASWDLRNVHVSECFNCSRLSVWIAANLAWPIVGEAPEANADLSDDVRLDYEEAGRILNLSPRGAAALLRLAIQKLCKELGGKGKKIDDDIAEMVKKGLDVRVQRALDIVRVIGNSAVHPGQVDLRDDRATALKLFDLANIIADKMISQPKAVDSMYMDLPEGARLAIEKRDAEADKL